MDIGFRLVLAEKELAHVRELQSLIRGQLDTSDARLLRIESALLQAAESLERLSSKVNTIADCVAREQSVATFLTKGNNGK